jgi:predicted transglutaminase-like cysteine proteinase
MHPFPWYFEGESIVQVTCVDDVCDWLLQCEYVRDPDLFNEADFWQHPRTFERLRQGDCEDYALWAWRKLVELGVEAELVSGTWHQPDGISGGHVWIRYRHNGREFILESVSRRRDGMVRSFEDAKAEYVPYAGVDHAFRLHAYSGYLRDGKRGAG